MLRNTASTRRIFTSETTRSHFPALVILAAFFAVIASWGPWALAGMASVVMATAVRTIALNIYFSRMVFSVWIEYDLNQHMKSKILEYSQLINVERYWVHTALLESSL
jgi:hypothetical protein